MAIFTILILPNHEHGIFLHLFVSSLISFSSGFWFSLKRSLTFLVSCIPRYFILFVAIVNGSSFLLWLSLSLLLVCRNACDFCTWFCILRLCWSCLSVSGVFGLRRWGLLDILLCHLKIVTIWLPPFLFENPLFLFLAWLLWLELPVLYWIGVVREGILV